MKKDIGFVGLNPDLVRWLYDQLRDARTGMDGADELAEGIAGLMNGKVSHLMLEMGSEARTPVFDDTINCGDLAIYPRTRKVIRTGQEIMLTPKEFDILLFLAKNRGEVFTKEQIYRAVWAEDYLLDDSNIMAFIRKLRKKIEPDPDAPRFILTIWGIGYKFTDTI